MLLLLFVVVSNTEVVGGEGGRGGVWIREKGAYDNITGGIVGVHCSLLSCRCDVYFYLFK